MVIDSRKNHKLSAIFAGLIFVMLGSLDSMDSTVITTFNRLIYRQLQLFDNRYLLMINKISMTFSSWIFFIIYLVIMLLIISARQKRLLASWMLITSITGMLLLIMFQLGISGSNMADLSAITRFPATHVFLMTLIIYFINIACRSVITSARGIVFLKSMSVLVLVITALSEINLHITNGSGVIGALLLSYCWIQAMEQMYVSYFKLE